ncbi:MAG: glycosyltransferase [Burkholderiales bacterium]|nr:glycosyltransferase [Burkholderiales bacterium]MDE2433738.1 glycosyltransferase [Burkholderiales bacterium]
MKLVFFCHPSFMRSQSMPRFARMLGERMALKGHEVTYWSPQPRAFGRFQGTRFEKWAGYLDQYVLFPAWVRRQLTQVDPQTLFVFCDQALGPWVPLVANRPHVVHAHDLLALRSALGLIPQNPTGWTGRMYQRYIRQGFQQARHFISVSKRTQDELVRFGRVNPQTSAVVYNGLNHPYQQVPRHVAMQRLQAAGLPAQPDGMLLHVGGDQWYKNTAGVIHLYSAYVEQSDDPLPLWMVSPPPRRADVRAALAEVPANGRVHFFQGLDNEALESAYSVARAFLFPSLAEGFGWPIIEAQACGCPVVTTNDAPMNEIGGPLCHYAPLPAAKQCLKDWARSALPSLMAAIQACDASREQRRAWTDAFRQDAAIDAYLQVYREVLSKAG